MYRIYFRSGGRESGDEDSYFYGRYIASRSAVHGKTDRRSPSTSKKCIFLSPRRRRYTRKSPRVFSRITYQTETDVSRTRSDCKHGKSINNFRVVFLQRAAGIQMRFATRDIYIYIHTCRYNGYKYIYMTQPEGERKRRGGTRVAPADKSRGCYINYVPN